MAVLALRLPFLNQAIQGDDLYYLYGAEHAQIEPLHPNHVHYAFLGGVVDMRGHSHPPFNSWYLGALLAIFGTVREAPFHAAYIPFSLLAAWSGLWLARRISPRPLAAALLFVATPAFVVNGGSLETDLPFVAFWLASLALFVAATDRRNPAVLAAAAVAMTLAALTSYQAVLLMPILLLYSRRWRPGWIAACTAPAAILGWQIFERWTGGAAPASMLAGYLQSYGLEAALQKARNALALTVHLAWLVFPLLAALAFRPRRAWSWGLAGAAAIVAVYFDPNPLFWASLALGVLILSWCAGHIQDFLCQWILIFFAAALVVFFAGSARYLLPVALPLAILVSREIASRVWLVSGWVCSTALGILLAVVNYQQWGQYREFARGLNGAVASHRVWINADWGFRFYLEDAGGLPLLKGQAVHPGELVVSSALGGPLRPSAAGGVLAVTGERAITSAIPLRISGLGSRSAYSTTLAGLRPFDVLSAPIDRVRTEIAVERKPERTMLPMNAPEAANQIAGGIYDLENGQWRWMSAQGIVLLKAPARPAPIEIRLYAPPPSPTRRITVQVDGVEAGELSWPAPGTYALETRPVQPPGDPVTVTITADQPFRPPGDARELSIVLLSVGFRDSPVDTAPRPVAPPPLPNR